MSATPAIHPTLGKVLILSARPSWLAEGSTLVAHEGGVSAVPTDELRIG